MWIAMDTATFPSSDEAELLNDCQTRASIEDIELQNYSHYTSKSPSPSLASATRYGGESEGIAPAYVPANSQQQRHVEAPHEEDQGPLHQINTYQSNEHVLRPWLWEILSIAAAAVALVAIVVVLALYRERTLPKWPSAITINALIAVFTAVLKACLTMTIAECIGQFKWLWYQKSRPLRCMEQWDLASRGPWGSLLLIFTLKSRDFAVIGAILTTIAMAVDPFTQQIIQFYSCQKIIENEQAIIPFSTNYTAGLWEGNSGWDPEMVGQVYIGLLAPPATTSETINFECRTGNCTFPSTDDGATFQSLALESRCTDIGGDISFTTDHMSDDRNDTYLIHHARLGNYDLFLSSHENEVMKSGTRRINGTGSGPSPYLTYLITDPSPDHRAQPKYTHAFECEFYPTVQTYSAKISNGALVEQILGTQRMEVWRTTRPSIYALLLADITIRDGEWHECTSGTEPSSEHSLPVNTPTNIATDDPLSPNWSAVASGFSPEELNSPSNNITWWPPDCVYSCWLPPQFLELASHGIFEILGNETVTASHTDDSSQGSPWGVTIWYSGKPTLDFVQGFMDGMTRLATARLRQGDGISVNAGPANGTVWGVQTCIHVEWGWLGLPAGLLLLTVVFLILTILKTRSRQARVWKSSVFAVLFSGLDQETLKAAGPVVSLEGMKAAADRATVRLEDSKDGFRLVSQA